MTPWKWASYAVEGSLPSTNHSAGFPPRLPSKSTRNPVARVDRKLQSDCLLTRTDATSAAVPCDPALTNHLCRSTLWLLGLRRVKRLHWALVLFLFGAVVCVSSVPRVDSPETSFNEADAPVNLAPPARPCVRLTPPAVEAIMVLPALQFHSAACVVSSLLSVSAVMPAQRHRHSVQDLLCTLLI